MRCCCWLWCWIALIPAVILEPSLAQSNQTAPEELQTKCINNLLDLEKSLLSKEGNIEALMNTFVPPNEPFPLVVRACYYVLPNTIISSEDDSDCENATYIFRWTKSQVHFFVPPDLLQSLSLYVIELHMATTKILLDPLCNVIETTEFGTSQNPEELLNQLTTSLRSYALKRASVINGGVDIALEGYSRIYNRSQDVHFIVGTEGQSFEIIEAFLTLSVLLLEILVTAAVVAMAYVRYNHIIDGCNKVKRSKANYFLRSAIITEIICSILFIAYVIIDFIAMRLSYTNVSTVRIFYYTIGLLVIMFVFNITVSFLFAKFVFKRNSGIQIFCLSNILSDSIIPQVIALLSTLTVAQAFAFHVIFLFLSFIISPVEAGATILLYTTILFSLVSAIALMLTILDQRYKKMGSRLKFICVKVSMMALFCFLLFFVIVFGYSFLRLTVFSGDTETGGVTSVIAAVIPSVFLAGLAWLSRKMLVLQNQDEEDDEKHIDDNESKNMAELENLKESQMKDV